MRVKRVIGVLLLLIGIILLIMGLSNSQILATMMAGGPLDDTPDTGWQMIVGTLFAIAGAILTVLSFKKEDR